MRRNCMYLVEGPCERKLIEALKENPSKIIPGKIKVFNVIQDKIPKSVLLSVQPDTMMVLVFDTDVVKTDVLRENIRSLKRYCQRVSIVYLAQVLNFEDEIIRCTDVSKAEELTKSKTIANFKSSVNRMKAYDFRMSLERHKLDMNKLWNKKTSKEFSFIEQNHKLVKI
ncbi:MAG: hypothetical protein Q4D13_02460 [Erysipelotrichaceae bacterium]|nr:hypothetical protein [Erysipelotrichaceae bacterium]